MTMQFWLEVGALAVLFVVFVVTLFAALIAHSVWRGGRDNGVPR